MPGRRCGQPRKTPPAAARAGAIGADRSVEAAAGRPPSVYPRGGQPPSAVQGRADRDRRRRWRRAEAVPAPGSRRTKRTTNRPATGRPRVAQEISRPALALRVTQNEIIGIGEMATPRPAWLRLRGLGVPEATIKRAILQKCLVRPHANCPPSVEHENRVDVPQCRKAMRHDNGRAAAHQFLECGLDAPLGDGIQVQVASSRTRSGAFLSRARAMFRRCIWPPDSRRPPTPSTVS